MESTKIAIDVGFCHIDCSHLYQNEEEIGQAILSKIEDGTVKREDIFYTSKVCSIHTLWLLQISEKGIYLDDTV